MSDGGAWSAVFGSYARRLRFPLVATVSFLLLIPSVVGLLAGPGDPRAACAFVGTLVSMTWTGLVSGHVKQTLARPQARLLPDYPRIQVLGGAALVLPVSALNAVFLWTAGISAPAAMALTLVPTSLYWAGPYLLNQGTALLFTGPGLLLVIAKLAEGGIWSRVNPGWSGDTWSAVAIVFSMVLIGFVAHRMLHLSESSFEYDRDPSVGWRPGRSYDQDVPFGRLFERVLPRFGHDRVSALGSRFGAGFWPRVQLWRIGMSRTSPVVTGLSVVGLITLFGALFTIHPENRPDTQAGVLVVYLMIFSLVRTTYVHRRRERVLFEALYPASREGMLRELGGASALDILETWLILCLGTLAAGWLGLFPGANGMTLLSYVAYTLGVTVLGMGFASWTLRLQTEWASQLVLIVSTLSVGGPVAIALAKGPGTEAVTAWASAGAALCVLGLAIGYAGYRSWCHLELGRTDLGSS